jgi:hypothetical protein
MKTSCFAVAGDLANAVAIDAPPAWFEGQVYEDLVPPPRIAALSADWKLFRKYYNEHLIRLDPFRVYTDLEGKVLLGHEREDWRRSPRRLVAEWIERAVHVEVPELFLGEPEDAPGQMILFEEARF